MNKKRVYMIYRGSFILSRMKAASEKGDGTYGDGTMNRQTMFW